MQFAEPPVVMAGDGGGVEVWLRLNRPLRDNEGALHEHPGSRAEIAIRGTSPDFPGLYRDDLHPTCYRQNLDGDLAAGDTITVALVLSARERITATADVEVLPPTGDVERRVLVRLRCPTERRRDTSMRLDGTGPGAVHGHIGVERHERVLPHGASGHAQRRALGGLGAVLPDAVRARAPEQPGVPVLGRSGG